MSSSSKVSHYEVVLLIVVFKKTSTLTLRNNNSKKIYIFGFFLYSVRIHPWVIVKSVRHKNRSNICFYEFLTCDKSPKTHQYVVASLPVNIVLYKSFIFSLIMIQFSSKPILNMSSANDNKGSSVWTNVYSNFKENSENIHKNSSGQSPFNVNIAQMGRPFQNNVSNQPSQQSGWLSPYSKEKKF